MNGKEKPRSIKNGKMPKRELFGKIESLDEYIKSHTSKVKMSPFLLSSDVEEKEIKDLIKKEVDFVIEILKPQEEDKILDLVSSHGEYSLELARRGFINVEGLDRSSNLIQKSRLRAKKENLNVKFREGTPRKLFYPPNIFDVVLLIGNVFGFFETPLDAFNVLKEIFRVLKMRKNIY